MTLIGCRYHMVVVRDKPSCRIWVWPVRQLGVQSFGSDRLSRQRLTIDGGFSHCDLMVVAIGRLGQFDLNQGLSARRAQVVANVLSGAVEAGALSKSTITVKLGRTS